MRLRPYIACRDYDEIKNWISDERAHAMWCANLIRFPVEKANFDEVMNEGAERFGDSPYVATTEDGRLIGFFCYSVNLETNEGMFKFVVVNPDYRGKGYGRRMLQLAVQYAFEITNAGAVQLNVFPENIRAMECYKSAGFSKRKNDKDAFAYKDELWDRCNMIMYRNVWSGPEGAEHMV